MDSPVIVDNASECGRGPSVDRDHPGFPFDEDAAFQSKIQSHLDDLATCHPEFAEHFLGPRWDSPFPGSLRTRRHRRFNPAFPEDEPVSPSDTSAAERPQRPAMDSAQNAQRNQRSMSAPPDNRGQQQPASNGQRFVSRVEISPQQEQQQQQPQNQQQREKSPAPQPQTPGNVRHIPIFVEGRDEPVLPKNVEPEPTHTFHRQPPQPPSPPTFRRSAPFGPSMARTHQHCPPHFRDPFFYDRDQFDGPRWGSHAQPREQFSQQFRDFPHQQFRDPHVDSPRAFHQPEPAQQPPYYSHQHQHQPPHSSPQSPQSAQTQPEPTEPPKPRPPPPPKDPLEKVALIQQEVDSLTEQVKEFSGTSRQDKRYIYLDEMLTRELIKLDDIETEGKENVRLARKKAIKTIQESIGLLESKVPLPQEQQPESAEVEAEGEGEKKEEKVEEETAATGESPISGPEPSQEAIPLPPCTSPTKEAAPEKQEPLQSTPEVTPEAPEQPPKNAAEPAQTPEQVTATPAETPKLDETAPEASESQPEATTAPPAPPMPEAPSTEQKPADVPAEAVVPEKAQDTKSPKKMRKIKKNPTPVSEQAIPLPPPESKTPTN